MDVMNVFSMCGFFFGLMGFMMSTSLNGRMSKAIKDIEDLKKQVQRKDEA